MDPKNRADVFVGSMIGNGLGWTSKCDPFRAVIETKL